MNIIDSHSIQWDSQTLKCGDCVVWIRTHLSNGHFALIKKCPALISNLPHPPPPPFEKNRPVEISREQIVSTVPDKMIPKGQRVSILVVLEHSNYRLYHSLFFVVSSAAVIWVVTQRFSPTNGCLNPNQICFPLFSDHMKITECTNHALPIVSSETNHVSVCQFPAQIHRLLCQMLQGFKITKWPSVWYFPQILRNRRNPSNLNYDMSTAKPSRRAVYSRSQF